MIMLPKQTIEPKPSCVLFHPPVSRDRDRVGGGRPPPTFSFLEEYYLSEPLFLGDLDKSALLMKFITLSMSI
jgi:hypothetical protein